MTEGSRGKKKCRKKNRSLKKTKIDFYLGFSFALLYIYIQLTSKGDGGTDGHIHMHVVIEMAFTWQPAQKT